MEGAAHAHVSHDRETASQRETAQLDVRLARVRRIGIPNELSDEGLLALPGSGLVPKRAVHPLEGGGAALEPTRAGA